jgi:predicted nucleic acid-binding protein
MLDSSVLIAAERKKFTTPEAVKKVREQAGDVAIVICSLTVAELAHGIYRADTPERSRMRRQFLDELKAHVPIHPVTESTAEIIARIGAAQAAKGITLPLADLIIGACALELNYAIGTTNVRDFNRIPGLNIIRL